MQSSRAIGQFLAAAILLSPASIAMAGPLTSSQCGLFSLTTGSLIECLNPNDSPGPWSPDTVTMVMSQDTQGVTVEMDDGTTIDIDSSANGGLLFRIDGATSTAQAVVSVLSERLSDDQKNEVADLVANTSETDATDELVVLLSE